MTTPNSTVSDELKPCPFCGKAPEVRGSVIGCKNLECWGPSIWHMANLEDSRRAWNTRHLSTGTDAGVRVNADALALDLTKRIEREFYHDQPGGATQTRAKVQSIISDALSTLEQQPAASEHVLDILDTIDPDEWAPDPDALPQDKASPGMEVVAELKREIEDIRDRCSRRPALSGAQTKDEITSRALSNSSDLAHIMGQCNAMLKRLRALSSPTSKGEVSEEMVERHMPKPSYHTDGWKVEFSPFSSNGLPSRPIFTEDQVRAALAAALTGKGA